mmetsp:Transcript_3277/g.5449  ORF Transcript_3277/g.5449 Transcript_3277/m.5449 type:complete len:235 (+) Transcript_3277:1152-1856(+)
MSTSTEPSWSPSVMPMAWSPVPCTPPLLLSAPVSRSSVPRAISSAPPSSSCASRRRSSFTVIAPSTPTPPPRTSPSLPSTVLTPPPPSDSTPASLCSATPPSALGLDPMSPPSLRPSLLSARSAPISRWRAPFSTMPPLTPPSLALRSRARTLSLARPTSSSSLTSTPVTTPTRLFSSPLALLLWDPSSRALPSPSTISAAAALSSISSTPSPSPLSRLSSTRRRPIKEEVSFL